MMKMKIVLVGDINPVWQAFREALETAGYAVWTAEGASDALLCLERVSPHLMIFTAVAARDYDAIRTLHAAAPDLDVLIAGEYSDTAAIERALQVGVDDFIFSPDTPLMLIHDLRRVAEHTSELAQVNQRLRCVMIERAQTEEQLRKLSRAVEQSPSATVITDLDARIEYVNPKFTEMTGYTLGEVYGQNPRVLKAEENPPEIYDALWAALKAGEEWRGEWINRRKDGSRYWEFASISAVKDAEGRATHYLKVAENITARKQAEARLREYTDNLARMVDEKVKELDRERAKVIQAGKMASLGEMATGVAHELNQPLTSMTFDIEYLQRLAKRGADGDEIRIPTEELQEIVEGLRGDVARSRRITDHLRTFGRASANDIGDIDLNQVIHDSFILIGERLRQHNVRIQRDLAPDLPILRADAFKLEQVFLNLISNAEHAMARRAEQAPEGYEKRLDVITRLEGDAIVARVRDNGIGISQAEQQRIFEPFFTTKPVGQGTGLGLSISHDIVIECGGEMTFESAAGEGTTFVLRFLAGNGEWGMEN